MGAQDERRVGGIIARGDGRNQAKVPGAVAVPPAQDLVGRHHHDRAGDTGVRVHVTRIVHLKAEGHDLRGRAAAFDGNPLIIPRALGRINLVGGVRNVAILTAAAEHERKIRTGAGEMIVGDHGPGDADLVQNGNDMFGKTGFGGKITMREGHVGAPENLHLPLLDAQFHFQRLVVHERRDGVMIGEVHQVQTWLAAAGCPRSRGLEAVAPAVAITKLAGSGEALDVFHERAGIIHLGAGVGITEQATERGLDFALIDVHPVRLAEDGAQHLRRRMRPTGVLLLDGVPGVFVMVHAIIAPVRPVNRLVQVPQPGRMDTGIAVSQCENRGEQKAKA